MDSEQSATALQAADGTAARSRRVRSVDHAIDVLEILGATERGLGVSDIARRCGLSKAATHHLLGTLETRRIVTRDPDSGHYRLDWALYELGSKVVHGVHLTQVARHYLDQLASQIEESVLLSILDGESVLYLDRGEAPAGLRLIADAGRRSPLHSTASGKALLAFAADSSLIERILSGPLPRVTSATITDPQRMRRELALVRQRGFATCWQEGEVGLCSIAMPARDHRGQVVAVIAIVGTSSRLNSRTVQQHVPALRATVRSIESRLGWPHPSGPTTNAARPPAPTA